MNSPIYFPNTSILKVKIKDIESPQNPQIKALVNLLEKSRQRRQTQTFLLEGNREIGLAAQAGYQFLEFYFCGQDTKFETLPSLFSEWIEASSVSWVRCKRAAFEKIAYRSGLSNHVLALCQQKSHDLKELKLQARPLILVIEGIEKPGNVGAMLRTVEAVQADAVIICDAKADLYNPNTIRSSVGGIFGSPIAIASPEETQAFLVERGIQSFAAYLEAADFYHQTDFSGPCALIMGSEAEGLSPFWVAKADKRIKIPMLGRVDSMNVSNAAAILLYEVKRQRHFEY